MKSAVAGAKAPVATRVRWVSLLAPLALLAMPGLASAHLERASYWPDPAPDRSVRPAAGGEVPRARSLASALDRSARGDTHVVCKPDSLGRALRSIRGARARGFKIRPSQPKLRLSAKRAQRLSELNRALFRRCDHRHIQEAVNAAGNNDRVVIMPGRYLEQPSRRQPTNDPRCDRFENDDGSVSYRYHVNCPNDANLIAVIGRKPGGKPPDPPPADRHGVPDNGPCIRCNLQIEGSGPKPHNVLIDLAEHPGKTRLRETPDEYAKDVGLALERADGAVVRNLTVAHAAEHGIYVKETDGYLIDRVRLFWNLIYGTLMFTSDHGVIQGSDGSGSGDASIYPGATPDTGQLGASSGKPRINTIVRRNDLHHSGIGCSCAAMGNSLLVQNNDVYDNGTGISTDSIGPAEHPGYPQDSSVYRNNRIYSNNFHIYSPDSDVPPAFFTVEGVGMAIWGGNNNRVEGNRIWDNWRYGTMLLSLPDALLGPDALPDGHVPKSVNSTGFDNRYTRNVMGIAPGGKAMPNGTDFWWDTFPGTTGNRWCNNIGAGGRLTSDPEQLPGCFGPSVSVPDADNLAETYFCGILFLTGRTGDPSCAWWQEPEPPASQTGAAPAAFEDSCELLGAETLACVPLHDRPGDPASTVDGPTALSLANLPSADCGDWNRASAGQRLDAVRALTRTLGEDLPEGAPMQVLPDGAAYELLDRTCSRRESEAVFLWGIYMQGASFSSYRQVYEAVLPELEEPPR